MTDQIKAMIALLENVIINQELMKIRLQYQINDIGTDIDSIDLHFVHLICPVVESTCFSGKFTPTYTRVTDIGSLSKLRKNFVKGH